MVIPRLEVSEPHCFIYEIEGHTYFHLITGCYASNKTTHFMKVTDYDCACPGENVSYTCTAVSGVITVWGGTALMNCAVGNDISLRHHDFENAEGECNNGAIIGYSIEMTNNSYTSRLDVRLSDDLQGRTITCSVEYDRDNNPSTVTVYVGNDTLTVSSQSGTYSEINAIPNSVCGSYYSN